MSDDDTLTAEESRLMRAMNRRGAPAAGARPAPKFQAQPAPAPVAANNPTVNRSNSARKWETPKVDPVLLKLAEEKERERERERQQAAALEKRLETHKDHPSDFSIDRFLISKSDTPSKEQQPATNDFAITTTSASPQLKVAPDDSDDEALAREQKRIMKALSYRGVSISREDLSSEMSGANKLSSGTSQNTVHDRLASEPPVQFQQSGPFVDVQGIRQQAMREREMREQSARAVVEKKKHHKKSAEYTLSGADFEELDRLVATHNRTAQDILQQLSVERKIIRRTFESVNTIHPHTHDITEFISHLASVVAPLRNAVFPQSEFDDLNRDFDYPAFSSATYDFVTFICENIGVVNDLQLRRETLRSCFALVNIAEEFISAIKDSPHWTNETSTAVSKWYAIIQSLVIELARYTETSVENDFRNSARHQISSTIVQASEILSEASHAAGSGNMDAFQQHVHSLGELIKTTQEHLPQQYRDPINKLTAETLQAALSVSKTALARDSVRVESHIVRIMEELLKIKRELKYSL